MWLLALALAMPAHAHRPHTPMLGLAVDPDDPDIAWAVLELDDSTQLVRSQDGGAHWDPVWSPVKDETVVGVAWDGELLLILALDGTLWSTDDGESWEGVDLPTDIVARPGFDVPGNFVTSRGFAARAGQLVIASDVGLWVGAVDDVKGMRVLFPDLPFTDVAFSATNDAVALAIADDGALLRSGNAGLQWATLAAPPGGASPLAVAEFDEVPFVGTDAGAFWYDGIAAAWNPCGELPVENLGDNAEAVPLLIADEDGVLYAASGQEALFTSTDDCESWQATARVSGVEYEGVGSAPDVSWSFTGAYVDGDHWIVAGFNGLASTFDAGGSWSFAKLIPGDNVRAIAFAPDYPDDPRLYLGGYGSGVYWTDDGGASWEGSAVGLPGIYANTLDLPDDFEATHAVYFVGNYLPYQSHDAGQSFAPMFVPMGRLRGFRNLGKRLYALGEDGAETDPLGRVIYSDDQGQSWHDYPFLTTYMDGTAVKDVLEVTLGERETILLATTSPSGVLGSFDRGLTWTWLLQGPEERSASLVAWPPGAPSRLVFAGKSAGVRLSDDAGTSWREVELSLVDRPDALVMADDGTLIVVSRVGQLYRSEDGGETWDPIAEPFAPLIHEVRTAPYFDVRGLVIVTTSDGVFYSPDRGDHFERMPRYERLEDQAVQVSCTSALEGPCKLWPDASLGNGGAWLLLPGDRLEWSFVGDALRLVGMDGGSARVGVDGERPVLVDVVDGALFLDGLDEGWHDVVVTVVDAGADGFRVDYLETFGPGEPLPLWEWLCGCGQGGAGAWIVLLPAAFTWRRRRVARGSRAPA
jgi:photosystem II stability/assembly factor-like uncharacterized protein